VFAPWAATFSKFAKSGEGRHKEDLSDNIYYVGLAAVLLASSFFRFWDLSSAPIWMDESFTIIASRMPLSVLLSDPIDIHPPLFYIIQKLWMAVNSDLDYVRVPAAAIGVLGTYLLTLAVADLVSRQAGILAGMFLAVSTGHIYVSQDARMYPLLMLGLTLVTWAGVRRTTETEMRRRWLAVYVLGALITVYSHALGVFLLGLVTLLFLCALAPHQSEISRSTIFARMVRANLIVAPLIVPWLFGLGLLWRGSTSS
jgi:uncharacterized membrane protein